jgi:hypothetical protein
MKPRWIAAAVSVAALGVAIAIILAAGGNTPDAGDSANPADVFGRPGLPSTPPVPTGRGAAAAAEFDVNPCGGVTIDELGVALATPFQNLSGTFLRRDRPAAPAANRCEYGFIADGTDTAETYHWVVITVTRVTADGARQLADCLAGSQVIPYGRASLGDEACLRAGPVLVFRLGENHYTLTVGATPPRADRTDEETELAPLVHAAAKLFATRLPSK